MITIPRHKVAIVPVFDSSETHGGIIKPSSFVSKREVIVYEIFGDVRWKVDETDDIEHAKRKVERLRFKGHRNAHYSRKKREVEDQPLDAGERCDQGVVKYIGSEVKEVKIGDYVFFSGYSGTLMDIEGEGRLILLPEKFIECTFDIDKFTIIPGLYVKSQAGNYFDVTYEMAMNIIAEAFTDLGLTIEVKGQKPKYEDYNIK